MGLKFNELSVNTVLLDKPLVEVDSRYDFTEWIFNAQQPSDGIVIKENEVIITKFKPNVPILISNFTGGHAANGTLTSEDIALRSPNIEARLSGFAENSDKFVNYEETNIRRYWITAKVNGVWFGPVYTYNGLNTILPIESVCDGTDGQYITYADNTTVAIQDETSALRGSGNGFAQYYHFTDGYQKFTPDWKNLPDAAFIRVDSDAHYEWSPGGNAYWQLAVALFTGYATDNDGYITLNYPITIHLENLCPVDPTTIEGYRVALKDVPVYEKARTLENTLIRHGLAFGGQLYYERKVNGQYPRIGFNADAYATVIGGRPFNSRATFKYTTGNSSLLVNDFKYLENLGWYPEGLDIARYQVVTVYGKILGIPSDSREAKTVPGSGRIYAINGTTSISGDDIPAPGTPGTAGTLAEPYTVEAAVARSIQLGVDQYGNGIPDTNYSYITGTIYDDIISGFAPPYDELYDRLRLPVPVDLEECIFTDHVKIKFWIEQYDRQNQADFWYTVQQMFYNNKITDPYYTNHLFTLSGGNLESLRLTLNPGSSEIIDMTSIFEESSLPLAFTLNIESGIVYSLVNAFRLTRNFSSITFTNVCDTVSDWNGSFEGTGLTNFPANLYPMDRRHDNEPLSAQLSGPTCYISDCADGSALTYFGNWISDPGQGGMTPVATLTPSALGTSNNVGSVTLDRQITSSDKVTIRARVCPGMSLPSYDSSTVIRLEPFERNGNTTNDSLVYLLQGVGYDANNNKVGASPTYICTRCSTDDHFNASALFAKANYTPDSMNTQTVGIHYADHVCENQGDTYFYREALSGEGRTFDPGFIDMELTAFGMQRMQINMYVFNINDTYENNTYTANTYSVTAYMIPPQSVTRYPVAAWAIEGTAVAYLEQAHMTVAPYCKNAFNSTALQEIRYILDMKYVVPARNAITDGDWYAVFNAPNLTTAYIQNLNKGVWNFDPTNNTTNVCAGNIGNLSATCANYLLENLFDLRKNDSESSYSMVDRLENDLNSFRGWEAGGTAWCNVIGFYAEGNATLVKTISVGGKLKLNVSLNGCTAEVKRSTVTVATLVNGYNEVNVYNGDTVTIVVATIGSTMEANITLAEPFMSELTENLTVSSIYLPASWSDKVTQAALMEAADRRWDVYIDGHLANSQDN